MKHLYDLGDAGAYRFTSPIWWLVWLLVVR